MRNLPLLVTLDNNCIIALENGEEPQATALKHLITFQEEGHIRLIVGWSTVFERPHRGEKPLWFPELEDRMKALGLGDAELFKHHHTMWFRNEEGFMTYEPEREYLRTVHEILFPNIDFGFQEYLVRYCEQHGLDPLLYERANFFTNPLTRVYETPATWERRVAVEEKLSTDSERMHTLQKIRAKWMNAKNDALGLCAHVSWGGHIFVTSDTNFYKEALSRLIPGKILRPEAAVQEILKIVDEVK